MPFHLIDKFTPQFIDQIIKHPPEPLVNMDVVVVQCGCGILNEINVRSLWRRWKNCDHYYCKSCHVKSYANDSVKIEKFKRSFAITARTQEHKNKCSKAGKKAWANTEVAARLKKAIALDNRLNPKKIAARLKAQEVLQAQKWYKEHLDNMRVKSANITKSNVDEFIAKAGKVHGNKYDYTKSTYNNKDTKTCITCPEHGEFWQSPHNHWSNGQRCPQCSAIVSRPHQALLDTLPNDVVVESNNKSIIAPYEIDIWIPAYKLGIEVHGEYWHGVRHNMPQDEKYKFKVRHHRKATKARNIILYQFWAHEINQKLDIIKSMLNHVMQRSTRIFARNCVKTALTNSEISTFYNRSHLQGHRNSSVNYALTHRGDIVCALGLSKHRKYQWEIIRYACALDTTVIGGFSKLFSAFRRDYQPSSVLTFADRRISNGNLYRKNQFREVEITNPNYFYFDKKNETTMSRQRCQKHKLPILLGNSFNPTLTEVQNMLAAGYIRVFDAGHFKFIWNKK